MKNFVATCGFALAAAFATAPADAQTTRFVSGPFTVTLLTFPSAAFLTPPTSTTGDFRAGTDNSEATNPFDNTPLAGSPFYSLRNNATLTYTLPRARTSFRFIWGTPDAYNRLMAYDADGNLIGTLTGEGVATNFGFTAGHYIQVKSRTPMKTIVATTDGCCFESSNQR